MLNVNRLDASKGAEFLLQIFEESMFLDFCGYWALWKRKLGYKCLAKHSRKTLVYVISRPDNTFSPTFLNPSCFATLPDFRPKH
jgi:hypothetical protein